MTKTAQIAAPSRSVLLRPSTLLLAAVVALEVCGAQALAQDHTRTTTVAAADGSTIYVQAPSVEVRVVAEVAN